MKRSIYKAPFYNTYIATPLVTQLHWKNNLLILVGLKTSIQLHPLIFLYFLINYSLFLGK